MTKPLSSCCEKPAKVCMVPPEQNLSATGEVKHYFCTHCGAGCDLSKRTKPFNPYSIPKIRKATGEKEQFLLVWARCKGKSEVSGVPLLPLDHPMWHFQFSHGLPKGTYGEERLELANITACTVDEHTIEWPLVKEKTDDELRAMGMAKWINTVTTFRALRLKSNLKLRDKLSGNA